MAAKSDSQQDRDYLVQLARTVAAQPASTKVATAPRGAGYLNPATGAFVGKPEPPRPVAQPGVPSKEPGQATTTTAVRGKMAGGTGNTDLDKLNKANSAKV